MLDYLRRIDVLPEPPLFAPARAVDQLLTEFVDYLRRERSLADDTVAHYLGTASRFLTERAARLGAEDGVGDLQPQEVVAFVRAEAERLKGSRRQSVAALRALLRFLHADGHVPVSLISAVPAVAGWHGGALPRALAPDRVERLLASCDRRTASGLRDFAMFTLLWRLGLRAGEVAKCRLGDIDWRAGEMLIRGRGNRQEKLPVDGGVYTAIELGRAIWECHNASLFVHVDHVRCAP